MQLYVSGFIWKMKTQPAYEGNLHIKMFRNRPIKQSDIIPEIYNKSITNDPFKIMEDNVNT